MDVNWHMQSRSEYLKGQQKWKRRQPSKSKSRFTVAPRAQDSAAITKLTYMKSGKEMSFVNP
ncbi:unnamed protein product [Arabidopsis lyrata]|nr:unnamed protein product [Arabidopsis lyrata]